MCSKMEVYEEGIVINAEEIDNDSSNRPEEVVIILPDESCFDYDESKRPKIESLKANWNKAQTRMLVDEYKRHKEELDNPVTTKMVVWEKIALKFNEKFGEGFTADGCANKWRSLKNTYKRVQFSQRSVASKRRWEFFDDLHSLYHLKMPRGAGSPVSSSSKSKKLQEQVQIIQFTPQASRHDMETDAEPPQWVTEFMNEYRQTEELKTKLLNQIHVDIVQIGERQCRAIEELVESLRN